jgi:hypothetical protein
MTKRITLALGATLLWVGATLAQSPNVVPADVSLSVQPHDPPVAAPMAPEADNPVFWAEADYLYSWLRAVTLPPLVTTSRPGTPMNAAGILGLGSTTTLFGGNSALGDGRNGGRIAAGAWFGHDRNYGFEGDLVIIANASTQFTTSSNATPIIAQPFTLATNFTQQAALISFPGFSAGAVAVQADSSTFVEAHLDFTARLLDDSGPWGTTLLAGYRYFHYGEGLHMQQVVEPTNANFVPGTRLTSADDFTTHNQFHGIDFGVRPTYTWQMLTVDAVVRVAFGKIEHDVDISGTQTTTVPGRSPVTRNAGLFAEPSNSGSFLLNDWTVVPEVGVGLSWRFNPFLLVRLGYSAVFLNGVTRAADQVNTLLNNHFFPTGNQALGGPIQPAFYLNRTDIWIQSVSAGVVVTY